MIKHENVQSMSQWGKYKGVVMDCCPSHFLINGIFQPFSCTLKEINYSFVSALHMFDFIMHMNCLFSGHFSLQGVGGNAPTYVYLSLLRS